MKAGGEAKVAIYWDFENLHAVLTDQQNGQDYYRDHRMSVKAPVVDVDPVLDYAASFGDVIIHRAYGNWQFFSRYRDALNGAGMDLIQMFPRGANMKNSADIRMALATNELKKPSMSTGAVAEAVGYQSEAAFSRAFKRHTSVTPAQWRKMQVAESTIQRD